MSYSTKASDPAIGEKIGSGATLSPDGVAKITYENDKTIVETNRGTFTLVPIKKTDSISTLKTINLQDPEAFARDFYPYKSIRELMMLGKPCPNASYVPEGYRTFTMG